MDWKKPGDFELPSLAVPAEYMLAYCVKGAIRAAPFTFLASAPDPQYASPDAFLESLLDYAYGMTQNNFSVKYAPVGWSPSKAAFAIFNKAVAFLKQVPVNAGDPDNTASVYDAWVAGTGALYDGKPAAPPKVVGDGVNAATGQSAAPPGSIL